KRAEKLSEQGWGILMPFSHFSARDSMEMTIRPLSASPVLRSKPMVIAIEWSHYWNLPPLRLVARLAGVTLIPIVIDDTLKKRKNYDAQHRPLPLGHGTLEYFRVARRALRENGIVWVSPQQGRRPKLELTEREPMKFVLGKENDFQNIAVMFIALSLKGEVDYSRRTGLDLGKTFDVKMGPTITKAELYALSREMGRSIDETTLIIYSHLVDPGYNAIKASWSWDDISKWLDQFEAAPAYHRA
ncbi:MAG: hypothetical protein ACM3JD_09370, partial [Rudaea sp.]